MKKIFLLIGFVFLVNAKSFSQQTASFYHDKYQGRVTRSGEIFDQHKMTCASNVYPIGTVLLVTNILNNKSVKVKVNDTGNFTKVTVDLSKDAFKQIANPDFGIIQVKIKIIKTHI
jgi:rare lipoprotein A